MKGWIAAGAVALAVGISGVGASGASANCITHPLDPSMACANSYPTLTGCDYQVDGHRARAWYKNGSHEIPGSWAPSGRCVDDVSLDYFPLQFRICVEEEGCSNWVRNTG